MKSKKLLVLMETLVIAGMAFGLGLAGCATGGGAGADPLAELDPVAAAQLADEINAIKAGSAKVNGETVTPTGWLGIKTSFTVPAR